MNSNKLAVLVIIFSIFFTSLLLFSQISASVTKAPGNFSSSLDETYAPGEALRGWINISLTNEPFNSLLQGFNGSIKVYDLLKKNNFTRGVQFNCTTNSCDMTYGAADNGSTARTFILNSGQKKVLGFFIRADDLDTVNNLNLNISSNATEGCSSPLNINIGKDDNSYEWYQTTAKSGSYCPNENYGCYISPTIQADLSSDNYCQTINVSASPGLRIGADITVVSGTGNITFSASAEGNEASCSVSVSASGKIGCDLANFSLTEPTSVYVCIKQGSGSGSFKIASSPVAPTCGNGYAYAIFLQSIKYAEMGNFAANSTKLGSNFGSSFAQEYISDVYHSDCSKGCYIPVIVYSNQDGQSITINNAEISYKLSGPLVSNSTLYELSASPSRIDMPFRKLNLPGVEFSVPSKPGVYNLSLKLGDFEILKQKINVLSLPIINELYPLEVPAGANVYFTALASDGNITGYTWNFGDNTTSQELTSNHVSHIFKEIRNYNVVVTVRNSYGTSNKTFVVSAISPKDYLPIAFAGYKKKINDTRAQLVTFPLIVKSHIESQLNLSEIELKMATLEAKFKIIANGSSLEYLSIANSLLTINLPDVIAMTDKASGRFIMDKSKVDLNVFSGITSETISGSPELIKDYMFKWFIDFMTVDVDYNGFFAFYQNYSVPLASYYNVRVSSKSDANVDKIYAIIMRPSSSVLLGSSISGVTSSGNSIGFSFGSGSKNFDFAVLNEKIGFIDMPLYFSPPFSQLATGYNISACNFNNICEKSLGEDPKNCRTDCKPWGMTIFWLIMVLIFFLAAYIAAQEWYKRKYENYLFKDKNDLFNLIHFISNAEKQGLKKEEIFQKLKEKAWANEQIIYAYRKFKGQRTGMWEIPVFKFMENKKVAKEINLRNKVGANPRIIPKPNQPFVRSPVLGGKPAQKPIIPAQGVQKAPISSSAQLSSQSPQIKLTTQPVQEQKSAVQSSTSQKLMPQKPTEQKLITETNIKKEPEQKK
jgi:PKD repeat protein